jgi:peptidoglycan hydrolase-like protein with peptidoglycan-binding domain
MHWEIGQAWEPGVGSFVSSTDVQDVIKRLGLTVNGARKPVVVPPVKTPHPTIAPFPGAFGFGAKGAFVVSLQKGLVKRGYKIVVDGAFGPQTKAAVIDVQRRVPKLGPADGIVGPLTYKTIAI